MKSLIVIACLLTSLSGFAKVVAEVITLRGKVTKLDPGAQNISSVKKGIQLKEDTSLVTGDRSMLRIKFLDGSIVTVGPKSKIVVVEGDIKKGGIVSLLTGRMRAQVKKEKQAEGLKNKFFIKTRSAAMGVRGTEFEVFYNQENLATSLVTYEGNVAMTKVSTGKDKYKKVQKQIEELEKTKKLTKEEKTKKTAELMNKATKEEVEKFVGTKEKVDAKKLDKVLEKSYKVEVKKGRFSGVTQHLSKVSEPVKISPVQFKVLRDNKELVAKKKAKKINIEKSAEADVIKKVAEEVNDVDTKDPHPEGFYDKKTDRYAPKAGGFIDMQSGLYVPPTEDSKFDKDLKVFVPKSNIGTLNSETGDYIPPKGLKLDAKKGFVLDKKALKSPKSLKVAKEKLVAMRQELNEDISHGVNLGKDKEESKVLAKKILAKKKRKQEYDYPFVIEFDQSFSSTDVEAKNDDNKFKARADHDRLTKLTFRQGVGGNVQFFQAIGIRRTEYDSNASISQNDKLDDGLYLETGIRFYPSQYTFHTFSFVSEEEAILRPVNGSTTAFQFFDEYISKLKLENTAYLYHGNYFTITASLTVKALFSKELEPEDQVTIYEQMRANVSMSGNIASHFKFYNGWSAKVYADVDGETLDTTTIKQKQKSYSLGANVAYGF